MPGLVQQNQRAHSEGSGRATCLKMDLLVHIAQDLCGQQCVLLASHCPGSPKLVFTKQVLFFIDQQLSFKPLFQTTFPWKIYQFHVNSDGRICLDVQHSQQLLVVTVSKVLVYFPSLLQAHHSVLLVLEVAEDYEENRKKSQYHWLVL